MVNWIIIGVNIGVFLLLQPLSFKGNMSPQNEAAQSDYLYAHALVPCEITHAKPLSVPLIRECGGDVVGPQSTDPIYPHKSVWFSVLASMFLHANWLHLAGNMFFLWMFGDNVEDRFGRVTYLLFYLVGGAIAALGHVLSDPNSLVPVVGASGAIAAVMGAYLVLAPRARLTAIIVPIFFLPFRVPAWIFLIEWLVLQFFTSANSGVAWIAHVAGFAAGVALALLLQASGRVTRNDYDPARG